MLDKLRALFAGEEQTQEPSIEIDLAAASLMLEVSWSDHSVENVEIHETKRLLKELYGLDATKADALIADAQSRLGTSVGLHPYTTYLNEHLGEEERFNVVHALWRLALADDRIDKFEEHIIRKASDLLYLSHSRFIEAKLLAKAES